MENTGFVTDTFSGDGKATGLRLGKVIDRDDPEKLGRIRAKIPGYMERTAWARPKGGGSMYEGSVSVPPIDADVYIQFVNDNPRMPVYERADYGYVDEESEVFPEHIDPDVHVFGIGPFRLVLDNREGQKTMRLKLVKEVGGAEEDIAWLEMSEEGNSIEIRAASAIGIYTDAIIDINAPVIQLKERKVMNNSKMIS